MEEEQKPIKHLIENIAVTPMPTHYIYDLLRSEFESLNKIKSWDKKLGLPSQTLVGENKPYDGIELTLWGMFDRYWNIYTERVKKFQQADTPIYTFHGCFEGCPRSLRGYFLNLADRAGYIVKAVKSHVDVVSELGRENPILIFHAGFPKLHDTREQALDNVIFNLESVLDYAQKKGVTITVENLEYKPKKRTLLNDYSEFDYVFDKLDHPNLMVTFDWGHLNTHCANNEFVQKHGYSLDDLKSFKHIHDFLDRVGPRIAHAHVHYNNTHILRNKLIEKKKSSSFFYYLFYWTKIAKYLRKDPTSIALFDEHQPYNRMPREYLADYGKTIDKLINKTQIRKYGYVTHEIMPKKIFKYIKFSDHGAEDKDFIESIGMFKKWY